MALLDMPVIHVDATVARGNGNNNSGHAGIKDTPVGTFGGTLTLMNAWPTEIIELKLIK